MHHDGVGQRVHHFTRRHPAGPGLRDAQAPSRLQKRQVGVRPAQQQHLRLQGVAAGQHRQVLHHDGVGQRVHHFTRRHPGLDQVDDVGLGEHPTLGGDGVQALGVEVQFRQRRARQAGLQQALVDRRAGAGGALVVHGGDDPARPAARVVLEQDDLGVLPAQLDDAAHLGVQLFHCQGDGIDLLHETCADGLGQRPGTGAGDEGLSHALRQLGKFRFGRLEHLCQRLRLAGIVALVARPADGQRSRVEDRALDRGRADVDTDDGRVAGCDHGPHLAGRPITSTTCRLQR